MTSYLSHKLSDAELEKILQQSDAASALWGVVTTGQVIRCCRVAGTLHNRLVILQWFAQHRSPTLFLELLREIVRYHEAEALQADQLQSAVTTMMSRLISQPVAVQYLAVGLQDLVSTLPENLRMLCAFYRPFNTSNGNETAVQVLIQVGAVDLDANACNLDLVHAELPLVSNSGHKTGGRRTKRSSPSPKPFGEAVHRLNAVLFEDADTSAQQWCALCVELLGTNSSDNTDTKSRRWLQTLQSIADVITTTNSQSSSYTANMHRAAEAVWLMYNAMWEHLHSQEEHSTAVEIVTPTLVLLASIWGRLFEIAGMAEDEMLLSSLLSMTSQLCSTLSKVGTVAVRAAVNCALVVMAANRRGPDDRHSAKVSKRQLSHCHGCGGEDSSTLCVLCTCVVNPFPSCTPEVLLPFALLTDIFAELWVNQKAIPFEVIKYCEPIAAEALHSLGIAVSLQCLGHSDNINWFEHAVQIVQSVYVLVKTNCKEIVASLIGSMWWSLEQCKLGMQQAEDDAMFQFAGFCCALCSMGNDSMAELLRWVNAHPASATVLLVLSDGATRWREVLGATQQHPAQEHAIESLLEGLKTLVLTTGALPSRLNQELGVRRKTHMSTPRLDRHLPPTMSIDPIRLLYSRATENELTFQALPLPQYEWFKCSTGGETDLVSWSALRLDRLLAIDNATAASGGPFGVPPEYARTVFAVHAIAQQSTLQLSSAPSGSSAMFAVSGQHSSELEEVIDLHASILRQDALEQLIEDHLCRLCHQLTDLYDGTPNVDATDIEELMTKRAMWAELAMVHACGRLLRLVPRSQHERTVSSNSPDSQQSSTKQIVSLLHQGPLAFVILTKAIAWLLEATAVQLSGLDHPQSRETSSFWNQYPAWFLAAGVATFNPQCCPIFVQTYNEIARRVSALEVDPALSHHPPSFTIVAMADDRAIWRSTAEAQQRATTSAEMLHPTIPGLPGAWRLQWCHAVSWVLPSEATYAAVIVNFIDRVLANPQSFSGRALRWTEAVNVMLGGIMTALFCCQRRMYTAKQISKACFDVQHDHPTIRRIIRTLTSLNCLPEDTFWLVDSLSTSNDLARVICLWSAELLCCVDGVVARFSSMDDDLSAIRSLAQLLSSFASLLSVQQEKGGCDYSIVSFVMVFVVRVFDGLLQFCHQTRERDTEANLHNCLFVLRAVLAHDVLDPIPHVELNEIVKSLKNKLAAANRVQLVAEAMNHIRTEECAAAITGHPDRFNHEWMIWSLRPDVELASTPAQPPMHDISHDVSPQKPAIDATATQPTGQEAWSLPPEMWSQFGF